MNQQQQQNNNNNELIEMFLDSASGSTIQPQQQQQQQQPQPIQTVTTATTTAGTTASPYIIQNGNIYQLTANNQLISRNTIQLNQIQSATAPALNDQQQQSTVPPKQIIINPCTQLNNRIKMTTIKNGSPTTFLNLNTSKGKVIYRTQPISTNTTSNSSDQTALRTINIQQQQQQHQQSSPKQIIISNSNANTSRLSALINSSSPPTSLNKTQPSIIVLAANNLQSQQKPISLIAKTPLVEQQQQQQPNLKSLNSLKQVAITNSNNNNSNGGVQFFLSNSAPSTGSTPHINNSNTQFTIQIATASDKQPQQSEIESNNLTIKNEQIESHSIADSNQFILQGNQVTSSNLQTILANNNNNNNSNLTPTPTAAAATLAGKAKNQKELVKITPIAVQPKSANKIQSILNRPVTTFLTTTATSTPSPPAPAPIPLSVNMAVATTCNLSNNNQQPNKTAQSRQQQPQQQQQQTANSNYMTNESQTNIQNKPNQTFIKIAAKNAQAQSQLQPQSQSQQSDENIMPSESILNELILPDTRIFASLLNKDSNAAAAASTAAAASCSLNQKDLANNKRVLTDLTYKTILIGNCEHIILDNLHNLADFRGDFTKLKNLASAVANRFNKPVTIPAFLLIENKLSLEKVKECLNEKQIHPIIIETSSTSTSNSTPQNNNNNNNNNYKTTQNQTNQTNKQFKEQNQHIIQTLNKQTPTVIEHQPQPEQQPPQIIATNTITNTKKSNASSSAKRINTIVSSSGVAENVTGEVLTVPKKTRKPKTCKAATSGAANAKFVSSLANELLSAANAGAASTSTANNTPVKLQDQLSTSTANISSISSSTQSTHLLNQSANLINVSNMSVNQILKLEQQQQQQQQQNQNSDQLLNNFISEVNNQQMNNCLIKKEIKIEQVPVPSTNELIGYNMQLQNQVSYDMLIASNNQMDLIQQQQQQQQQTLQLQESNENNQIYIQQTHDQMVDISQNNNYIIQQQQQPITFTNQANDYDFNFDPFDSNALFNLNEMEFI